MLTLCKDLTTKATANWHCTADHGRARLSVRRLDARWHCNSFWGSIVDTGTQRLESLSLLSAGKTIFYSLVKWDYRLQTCLDPSVMLMLSLLLQATRIGHPLTEVALQWSLIRIHDLTSHCSSSTNYVGSSQGLQVSTYKEKSFLCLYKYQLVIS